MYAIHTLGECVILKEYIKSAELLGEALFIHTKAYLLEYLYLWELFILSRVCYSSVSFL